MAKSVKQQMYEQLANQHVQQALNNIGMQQFQEAYNAWNAEQDGMAEFQAAYNAWNDANPVQTQTPQVPQQIPSLAKSKSRGQINDHTNYRIAKREAALNTPEKRREKIQKNIDAEDYFRQQQEEQALASQPVTKAEERKKIQQNINTEDYFRQQQQEQMSAGKPSVTQKDEATTTALPDMVTIDVGNGQTKEVSIQELADLKGISIEEMRAELDKADKMKNQTIEKPGEIDEEASSALHEAYMEQRRKDLQRQQTGYESFLSGMGSAVTAPIVGPIKLAGELTGNDWDLINEYQRSEAANAREQHPWANTAGNIAGMLLLAKTFNAGAAKGASAGNVMKAAEEDALINGATKAEAIKHGLGVGARQMGRNVAAQMPFDLATTIVPTLANDIAEGKSKKDIAINTLLNTLINAGWNSVGDVVSIAGTARKGLPTLTAAAGDVDLPKITEPDLPKITNEEELISDMNKQLGNFMDDYNASFKDTSAMKDIFTPEDLEASQSAQLKRLMEENLIPERVNPAAEMEGLEQMYADDALKNEIKALNEDFPNMWKGANDTSIPKLEQPEAPSVAPKIEAEPVAPKAEAPKADISDATQTAAKQADNAAETAAKTQRTPVSEVNNPSLTYEQNEMINSSLFDLEAPLRNSKVENAVENLYGSVKSQTGIDLADSYSELSKRLRTTTDAGEAQAISDQLKELKKGLNGVDAADKKILKDIMDYNDVENAIVDYKIALNSGDTDAAEEAAKALDAARNRIARRSGSDPVLKDVFSGDYGPKVKRPLYHYPSTELTDAELDDIVNDWVQTELSSTNRYVKNAEPDRVLYPEKAAQYDMAKQGSNVPGSDPLQYFGEGTDKNQWKIHRSRLNTFENQGWGEDLPAKNYAYRVWHESEQHEVAQMRGDSFDDLLHKDYYDAADVKGAMSKIEELRGQGNLKDADRLAQKLAYEGGEGGRVVQAFKEYNKDSFAGALGDAHKYQEDNIIQPWASRNTKAADGNKRIAKALSDMGHKLNATDGAQTLTHEQIKKGVIAELEKEVGSIEGKFTNNDIEYLTMLAEDKSIPVWQITSELEHKLSTGKWYTIDESIPLPKPTNAKLQNALNSLIEGEVRVEQSKPSLDEITEQVRNTLAKESANFDGQFTENDIQYLANLINEGATQKELTNALNMKLATGTYGISDATLEEVDNIFKQISNYDPDSKQFVEGQLKAYKLLANELVGDATPMEKFEAWRYLAMLGNPKTMLRNAVGNLAFNVVTDTSNAMAAVGESGVDSIVKGLRGGNYNNVSDYLIKTVGGDSDIFKKLDVDGIQRTKSLLNPFDDMELISASAEDANASSFRQLTGGKYEKFSKDSLRRYKSVFNTKAAQGYEKLTDAGINDYPAAKLKYSTSLAGYLKANGYDESIFDAERELTRLKNLGETQLLSDAQRESIETLSKDVDVLEKARKYAIKQAEYATFHEDNAIAKWLTETSQKAPKPIRALIEGTVPFKKTPANILRSGYEYSPLGVIRSLKKTGKFIIENTGKNADNLADVYKNAAGKEIEKTLAADVIESWSKTLTGTGLAAFGAYLYDKGVLNVSNKDTKYQDQLEGIQNYSLKIGDKTYTIDWAAPGVMPLLLGVQVKKAWDSKGEDPEKWYDKLDDYLNAANSILDPMIETSFLSGVRDTLKDMTSNAKEGDYEGLLTRAAYQMGTGYLTQAIPTLFGQVARTVDNTRRSTYTDKEGVAGTLEKQGRKLMNKLPVLSMLNQPYVDTYGREQTNSPFDNPFANLAYQMLSPGYLQDINTTDADTMSREAYEVSKNTGALPQWKSYFTDSKGNRVSPEDYTTAAKAYGQANYEIRNELANDEWFKSLDDAQKEEIVKGINTISEHVGKAAIDPEYETTSKPYLAYKEGGVDGLINYYKDEADKDVLKEISGGNVQSNSKAGEEALSLIKQGKIEEAQKVVNDYAEYKKIEEAYDVQSGSYIKSDSTQAIKDMIAAGDVSGAEELAKQQSELKSYGFSADSGIEKYNKAKAVIPSLTTKEFATTYNDMDTNKKSGISQTEFLDYLNRKRIPLDKAQQYLEAYGGWENKKGQKKKLTGAPGSYSLEY